MKRYLFLLLIIAALQHGATAQDIHFATVDPPKDRPWGTILEMTQDKQGYLWLAGDGLYKYDGHQYTVYKHDPSNTNSLASNRLEAIFTDKAGIIWISVLWRRP